MASQQRMISALGGQTTALGIQRHVSLHMLSPHEVAEANRTLSDAGICCNGLLQFFKLTLALSLVRRRELKAGPYVAIVKFRHDFVNLAPLLPSWRSVMTPGVLWAYHDQMLMGERDTVMAELQDLWPRGIQVIRSAGKAHSYRPLAWQRLARDLKARANAWASPGCSNFFESIEWPAAYARGLGSARPSTGDVQHDADKLASYAGTNFSVNFWFPQIFRSPPFAAFADRIIEPEAFLGLALYDPSSLSNVSVRCLGAALRGVLMPMPKSARRWQLDHSMQVLHPCAATVL